jgi:hypothetical protein
MCLSSGLGFRATSVGASKWKGVASNGNDKAKGLGRITPEKGERLARALALINKHVRKGKAGKKMNFFE